MPLVVFIQKAETRDCESHPSILLLNAFRLTKLYSKDKVIEEPISLIIYGEVVR